MLLSAGTRLGPYEILAPLGAGGMGEVYRARDMRLERTVAIKILPAQFCSDPVHKQRFEREAKTISNLNHPHICVLHDIGRQDGIDYLVMECVEGETLAKRLEKGPLPLEQVLKLGAQIADALDKAHRNGVVHRDLKPGNIMLTSGEAKLLDFGLAKLAAPLASLATLTATRRESPVTEPGSIVGTVQYMSPEQVEAKELDGRSDIFSLGSVLYEMVTGKKAFEGKSQLSVASAILEKEPAPIGTLKPMTPPALDHAIRCCFAKDPDDRWQTARDLALEMKWIAEAGPLPGAAASSSTKKQVSPAMAWGVAATCLLALVAIVATLLLRPAIRVPSIRASLLPPPNSSFLPNNFAVSPDGRQLAFVALGSDGKTALWVRALSASGAQQVNGTEGASFPFWSPDSRQIGFFADARLKTVDVTSDAVKVLCDAFFAWGGTWNRDGTIVFGPVLRGPLYRVPASGGAPAPVTRIVRKGSIQTDRWPFFLPDGKHFLYFADWSSLADPQGDGIYVGSLDAGEGKLVSAELQGNVFFASGQLLYVRARTLMAQPFDTDRLETTGSAIPLTEQELEQRISYAIFGFSVSQNGVLVFQSAAESASRLVWYDQSGKEAGQLPDVGYADPNLSPDGRFLAVSSDDQHNGKHFIRVYDFKRGISTRLTSNGDEHYPVWSRDGKQIAYRTGGIAGDCYEVPADGSGPPKILLKSDVRAGPQDWSPDGRLMFMTISDQHPFPSLAVYSPSDHKIEPFAAEGVEAKFSPDGKWVVYVGPGRGILVEPFPGPGRRIQVSTGAAAQPRWSLDGRQIFFIQPDRKLIAVGFDPRAGTAGTPRVLFQTRIAAERIANWQYDVAPDGRFIINSLPSNIASPLTLITGWDAALARR
jgi:serine/threonine protein kinase/dipeptidyl aminopeptidase/acylaminoacyl peptidase